MSSFAFKLDPSSLPKLTAKGDNFAEWRSSWTIALKYAKLYDHVSGKSARPAVDFDEWDEQDNRALVMILSSIQHDLTMLVTRCKNSHEAWTNMASRFDRDTTNNTMQLFRQLANMRHKDGDDLQTHVDSFHQLWTKLERHCIASAQLMAKTLKPIFESDEIKGSFFLLSLPEAMDNVVDNLTTRDVCRFTDIEPKILDIANRHNIDEKQVAYYTQTTREKPRGRQQGHKPGEKQPNSSPLDHDECSWCRKHNFNFVGHIYTNCNRLADMQKNRQKPTSWDSSKQPSTASARIAHDTEKSDEDDVVAFSAAGNEIQSATRKESPDKTQDLSITAYAVNIVPQKGKQTISAVSAGSWLLDTGASRHMTGNVEDFISLEPRTGMITVAGGLQYPIEGVGIVQLLPTSRPYETI